MKIYCERCKGTGYESIKQSPTQEKCSRCKGKGYNEEDPLGEILEESAQHLLDLAGREQGVNGAVIIAWKEFEEIVEKYR